MLDKHYRSESEDGDTPPSGGTKWEIETASEQMIVAMRGGDPDAVALAMRRFGEGLKNVSMGAAGSVVVPVVEPLLVQVRELTRQTSDLTIQLRGARKADLDWRTEERELRVASSERIYSELDELSTAIKGAVHGLGKIQGQVNNLSNQVNDLSKDMAESKRDRAELRTRLERIEQMMLSAEQREEAAAFWRKLQQWYDEAHPNAE